MLRTFSTGRNLPPSVSDLVLGYKPIFSPHFLALILWKNILGLISSYL